MTKTGKPAVAPADESKAPASKSEAPGSAPAVPSEILRQLTEDFEASHARKMSTDAKTAPKIAAEATALGQVATDASADQPAKNSTENNAKEEDDGLSDPETDRAVDDIVAKEGDTVLAAEDAQKNEGMKVRPPGAGHRLGNFFRAWWRNKWARWLTILVILAIVSVCAAVPKIRYHVLNTMGVRSSLSLVVLDNTTQLPLKNVTVTVAGKHTTTTKAGVASFAQLELGPATLKVERVAFAPVTKQIVVGWGSNPQGDFSLRAVGTQYTIKVGDYLSGQPLPGAEATTNGFSAIADKTGKIILTLDNKEGKEVPITLILKGYRDEHLVLPAANTLTTSVLLVPDRKAVFVSKQSGRFDLYKMDVDGKNKQVLLPGTGLENQNISLVVSASGTEVALVSTRDNMRDDDGFLMTTLTVVDIASGRKLVLDHAEQIQLRGWVDRRLIYNKVSAGASAANPLRYRLISYDYVTNSRLQLAAANQFNGILVANGLVYYTTSATDPAAKPVFAKARPDGTGRQVIMNQEVWTMYRSDYNTLLLQTEGGWYSYALPTNQLAKATTPTAFASRQYIDSPEGQRSLWTEVRDGKGALLVYNLVDGKDTQLQIQPGLTNPVRWLNNTAVIYRVSDRSETADYVLSLLGGQARKISDVTHTYGFSQGN